MSMHLLRETVRPEWIDYNGHLYDGYYAVIFAKAVDEFLEHVGLDADTRASTRRTIYTLETHVRFLREVKLGAPLAVTAQLLEVDAKRARLFLEMHDTARDILAATSEQLLMSIDQSGEQPRSAPWLETSAAILEDLARQHAGLPVPEAAGRGIAIRR
ncbi:thioesterase family protein [Labrys wisconsinensis]|uniref:Acyl-CoA thioester hydrolase n=1 Tax=Labrys wisconsinensis TaxID=425677 RepID=A0ABU0JDU3_9HYPH|nr:thioesterase family protein [Labrys wisconsinensis]MDQ0472448.1 acyl-CoA thioester hydrolase [Labrys wisconsinensis]